MKYGILLIGFEYIQTTRWKTLPGIPVDLYQTYRYFQHITKNIMVFTDIDKDYKTSVLQKAILDGYVDSNLLSFIEDIKERHQYTLYDSNRKNGYNINNFDEVISIFTNDLDRLVVYYTGHGKGGDIILPDNTHVSLNYLRNLIISNVSSDCQILSVLDCCQSNGMDLPYCLSNGNYKLNNIKSLTKQRILCISSSQLDQDSSATRSGSLFTRVLFEYLEKHQKSIISINEINNYIANHSGIPNPNTSIYSSYPNIRILWPWITMIDNYNNLDIAIDNNNSLIRIRLNNCQPTVERSSSMRNYIRYHHIGRYDTIY